MATPATCRERLSLVIPMRKKRNQNLVPAVSARLLPLIVGLAACFAVLCLLPTSLAQPVIRTPAGTPPSAAPAQRTAEISSLLVSYLPNGARTRLSDTGASTLRRGSWMRILIQFTSRPAWIDEIRFDCYVLMRDRNTRTLLTGSVTCVYVKAGRQHLAAIFVPPSVVERYGRPEYVAVESYVENTVVSDYTVPRTSRKWWQDYTGVPDTMVSWFNTPFLRDGIERYEQVKIGRQGF